MELLKHWWDNSLPKGVKVVFGVLLANAVPAIIILMTLPGHTDTMFVWTVKPAINVRLMGVMYANALIMIGIGAAQTSWARVRVVMVVITLFSVFATVLTFFFLKPFLAHPWFHLAYWLGMYLILFVTAPVVFVMLERRHGGRLPVEWKLNGATRLLAIVLLLGSLASAILLIFRVDAVNEVLPWTLPPLVGGMIGVLFSTHSAAYGWALWDGDWRRTRPIFWQVPVTALLFFLLPLLHPADLRAGSGSAQTVYLTLSGLIVLASAAVIAIQRAGRRENRDE